MADYSAETALATELLAEFGMSMEVVRRTEDTTAMPTPGGGYPVTETRYPFTGVRTAPTLAEVQAGVFAGEDVVVLVPGSACPDLDTTDSLFFLGKTWRIQQIRRVAPAEGALLFKVSVKES